MKNYLNTKQIEYVLFHFKTYYNVSNELINKFVFEKNTNAIENHTNKIIFLLSNNTFEHNENILLENNIPVFFPVRKSEKLYEIQNNNLVFNYDIIKSAFYLLSGYQEFKNNNKDIYGRFPFKESVQYKLNIIKKPVVNYYFKFITEAINTFYNNENIKIKNLFNDINLLLTHDVDRLEYYTFNNFLYKIKEFTGLANSLLSKKEIFDFFILYLIKKLKINIDDPVWNFEKLIKTEQQYNYKSAFYFLQKGKRNIGSKYSFSDKKIQNLIKTLTKNHCETGLHGTVDSAKSGRTLKTQKKELETACKCKIYGGRQHYLMFFTPETMIHQEKAGLEYDSSLCFAEHEGFRNSFCLPFKLYDFDKNKIIDVWEFPLTIMDTTLFYYRKLTEQQALNSIAGIIAETKKFNGINTILWHNGFEVDYPDGKLKNTYSEILKLYFKHKAKNFLPIELLKKIKSYHGK